MSVARGSSARRGVALPGALAFAGAAIALAWLALHSLLLGPYAGTARRTLLAYASLVVAAFGLGTSLMIAVRAVVRRRRLAGLLRAGERIVGTYPVELLPDAEGGGPQRALLTMTNQRVLINHRGTGEEVDRWLEHEEIEEVIDDGPARLGLVRRCVLHTIVLRTGQRLPLRMSASTALDFEPVSAQYLSHWERELRALVVEAEGPTPSRPVQPLDTMLVDGKPTVCLLELDHNYLRIIGEHSPPMADLYYYFHWEHMQVGEARPPGQPHLPDDWRCLRLVFHEHSSIRVCGVEPPILDLRQWALSAGAAPVRDKATGAP